MSAMAHTWRAYVTVGICGPAWVAGPRARTDETSEDLASGIQRNRGTRSKRGKASEREAGASRRQKGPDSARLLLFPTELPAVVDGGVDDARFDRVDVVLRKLGKGARAVAGRLVRAPRKGSVVVIEFPDGMHEYVTTPVKRVLRIAGREVFYIETINSRYRLEVRGREATAAEGTG
jgi:hypothetical protein